MDNIVDRDLLTEGSVWVRENGKRNTVLFLTNRTLSPKIQKKHPPQVVYTDEQGNIFNQSVTNFLTTRTFLNVNPTMETRCLSLTMNMEEDEGPGVTDVLAIADEEEGDDAPEADSVIARFMAGNGGVDVEETAIGEASETVEVIATRPAIEFFPMNDPTLAVSISSQDLQDALASYEVAPNLERGAMVHTLSFRCENNEVANNIFKAFHGPNSVHNLLYGFRVFSPASKDGVEEIRWTHSLGVYPYVVDGENFVRALVMGPSPVPVELPEAEAAPEATQAATGSESYQAAESMQAPADLLERVEAVIEAEKAETQTAA